MASLISHYTMFWLKQNSDTCVHKKNRKRSLSEKKIMKRQVVSYLSGPSQLVDRCHHYVHRQDFLSRKWTLQVCYLTSWNNYMYIIPRTKLTFSWKQEFEISSHVTQEKGLKTVSGVLIFKCSSQTNIFILSLCKLSRVPLSYRAYKLQCTCNLLVDCLTESDAVIA